jgi:hypothetical protein
MKVHVNGVFFDISELLVKSDLWKVRGERWDPGNAKRRGKPTLPQAVA